MKTRMLFLFFFILLIIGCNNKTLTSPKESDNWKVGYSDKKMTILAVTGHLGTGSSQFGDASMWTSSIDLLAWRSDNPTASIHKEKVSLEWMVTEDELESASELMDPNQIVKLQVYVSKTTNNSMLLDRVLETDVKDDELEEILNEELKPIYYHDEQFGTFQLDKGVKTFGTDVRWTQKPSQLSFNWDKKETVMGSSLQTAYQLFEKQEEWDLKIKTFASEELLDLANEWLEDDNESNPTAITKEMFVERMTIDSISVYPNGDFEMYFLDGDLFFGHYISVFGNVNGEFEQASISG